MYRKINTLIVVIALVLFSCSKNEMIPNESGGAIGFSTYVGTPVAEADTKAASITSESDMTSFIVNAFYTAQTAWASYIPDYTAPNFMNCQDVNKEGNGWGYTPQRFWSTTAGDKISFFAYSPEHANIGWGSSTKENIVFTLGATAADQVDFLYAENSTERNIDRTKAGGNVGFAFKHALSRVGFSVRADLGKDYSDKTAEEYPTVTVTSITLGSTTEGSGFYAGGEFDLYGKSAAQGWVSGKYGNATTMLTVNNTDEAEEDNEIISNGTEKQINITSSDFKNITKPDGYLMVIPQNFSAGLPISVDYTIEYPDGPIVEYTKAGTIEDANFEMGKAYSIGVDIRPNGIEFDLYEDTNWGDEKGDEIFIRIQLDEANSYIINPHRYNTDIYSIPVNDRLKSYWVDVLTAENSESRMTDDDIDNLEWVAEVIWQDQPEPLIIFCDKNGEVGNNTSDISAFPFTFTRNVEDNKDGKLCFKLARHNIKGNVLIGVKPANIEAGKEYSSYLWSWHLWITDYNPNQEADKAWTEGQYIYPVPGGEIHRYDDGTDANGNPVVLWGEDYRNKYMMDRNLGAMMSNLPAQNSDETPEAYKTRIKPLLHKTGGLSYEFGRKDPLPIYTTWDEENNVRTKKLYNIKGEDLVSASGPNYFKAAGHTTSDATTDYVYYNSSAAQGMYESVNTPYKIFPSNSFHWLTINSEGYKWYNPSCYSSNKKSLYDPCPAGWMVPERDAFLVLEGDGYTRWVGRGEVQQGWCLFLVKPGQYKSIMDFTINSDKNITASFPAVEVRKKGGEFVSYLDNGDAKQGFLWTSYNRSIDSYNICYLMYGDEYKFPDYSAGYSYVLPVRCVKE